MNNEQDAQQPELPAMVWANHYICPKGHFYDHEGHASRPGVAWVATWCNECSRTEYGRDYEGGMNKVFYGREEWSEGAKKLIAVATSINQRCLGKDAKCDICNKTIPAKNDKAYHLQKHYSTAITEEEAHHIQPV